MIKHSLYLTLSVLAALIAAGVGLSAPERTAQAARPAQEAASTYKIFLPVVARSSVIFGRVTQGGASAAGVPISLRFYNGSSWSTLSTVTTDTQGQYRFVDVPSLGSGQKYQAVFNNTGNNDAQLAWWGTRELTSYSKGTAVEIGNFDIAAVPLVDPLHDRSAGLPATFRWTRRPASTSDSYALRLYDSSDLNPLFVSNYVGYSDSYAINSLPSGFSAGTAYTWDVVLRSPDGGTGVSRQARTVRLLNGIHGRVTLNGAPAGGVLLQLRSYNGSWWTTAMSTTTSSDGSYNFGNVPTLSAGQKYYVRYQNSAQTDGRLFLWSTRSLTSYTNGASVAIGDFDIADVTLVNPPAGSSISLPYQFQWNRRPATTSDSYILEIYDPADYTPRWLSPLLGYVSAYTLNGLAPELSTNTNYAWDLIISSPDGGSGVSRVARLVRFTNRGSSFEAASAVWPFEEELPPRPPESYEGEQ